MRSRCLPAHNPEVRGSNPGPATTEGAGTLNMHLGDAPAISRCCERLQMLYLVAVRRSATKTDQVHFSGLPHKNDGSPLVAGMSPSNTPRIRRRRRSSQTDNDSGSQGRERRLHGLARSARCPYLSLQARLTGSPSLSQLGTGVAASGCAHTNRQLARGWFAN
jgi:hypothetical protein